MPLAPATCHMRMTWIQETVFPPLVLYSLSSLSAHLPQSPLRSCPCIYIHTHVHMGYEDRHTSFWCGSVYLGRGNVGWQIFLWPSLESTTCHSSKTSWAMNSAGTSLWSASALFVSHTKILKKCQDWEIYNLGLSIPLLKGLKANLMCAFYIR